MSDFKKVFLLDVGFTNEKEEDILEFIATSLKKSDEKYYIVTPNPELLVLAHNDSKYKTILNNAKLALPDGIGVTIASKLLGVPIKQRISGVDFTESLCKYVAKQPITVAFLGAGPNVAEKTAECLREKYPSLKVAWVSEEFEKSLEQKKSDILFVAFGSPKQEIFIYDNLDKLPAKVIIGVGGSFDFISSKVKRAPKFLRSLGLEWLFRLFKQPWRIKRQLSLLKFIELVFKEKFNKSI